MESFTIHSDTLLYHGSNNIKFIINESPLWCAHNVQNANKYGKYLYMIKPLRKLKLIDISNISFHNDYISRVNNLKFTENSSLAEEKAYCMLALGLPNFKTQLRYLPKNISGVYPNTPLDEKSFKIFNMIEMFSPYFGERHRYSLESNGINLDKRMVSMLMELYPDYDGYICKSYWPSYHLGGFMHPETCIFKPLECLALQNKQGGRPVKRNKKNNETEKITEIEEYLKNQGLTLNDVVFYGSPSHKSDL